MAEDGLLDVIIVGAGAAGCAALVASLRAALAGTRFVMALERGRVLSLTQTLSGLQEPGAISMIDPADQVVRFSLNWAEAQEGMVRSIGGRVMRQPDLVATDVGRPAGLMNSVVLLNPLNDAGLPALMASLDAFFRFDVAKQAGPVYMFTAWPVPDLTAFGWVCVEQMPLMVRHPGGGAAPMPPGLRISEVRCASELHHFEQVMIKGFPVPDLEGLPAGSVFGPSILEDERFRFWLGWQDEQPVCGAAAYVAHGLVDLTFLASLPQARGHGYGSALAWIATLTEPHLPAMLIASEEGLPLYTRMGYRHLCDMPLWSRERL